MAQVEVVQKLRAAKSFEVTDMSHCDGPHGYTTCRSIEVTKELKNKENKIEKHTCKIQIAGSNFNVEKDEEFNFGQLVKVDVAKSSSLKVKGMEARAHQFSRLKIICDFEGSWSDVVNVIQDYFSDQTQSAQVYGKKFGKTKAKSVTANLPVINTNTNID